MGLPRPRLRRPQLSLQACWRACPESGRMAPQCTDSQRRQGHGRWPIQSSPVSLARWPAAEFRLEPGPPEVAGRASRGPQEGSSLARGVVERFRKAEEGPADSSKTGIQDFQSKAKKAKPEGSVSRVASSGRPFRRPSQNMTRRRSRSSSIVRAWSPSNRPFLDAEAVRALPDPPGQGAKLDQHRELAMLAAIENASATAAAGPASTRISSSSKPQTRRRSSRPRPRP